MRFEKSFSAASRTAELDGMEIPDPRGAVHIPFPCRIKQFEISASVELHHNHPNES